MRYYVMLVFLLINFLGKGQETYSKLTDSALKTMWKAKDENGYRQALEMYEYAFTKYPDSIDATGLYKSSVIASELKEYDKAFRYLTPLAKMNTGEAGWSYIIGESAESEYKNLLQDPRWAVLKQNAIKDKEEFHKNLNKMEEEFYKIKQSPFNNPNAENLYQKIKTYNPYLSKEQRDYSITFKINDSVKTSFFIHLPEHYRPDNKYPLLFFLHGAVRNNVLADYQTAKENLEGWNRFYTKYADLDQVILVFPKGSKKYNWMAPDDGFSMIPEMLKQIKKAINVDDNKVFVSGHSNGATGSFSYLMKQPTPFAGFYGFNTYPKVFTGGTFIDNIKNRSFISFSTDEDYYYPTNANDDLTKLMKSIKADYREYRYKGFPHWFPQFDESEPAYQILFSDLKNRKRNPFPNEITWEFDDEKYGNIDWLSNIKLDTTSSRADWHKNLNFKITSWLKYDKNDSLITEKVDKYAFDLKRKSGKVKAYYGNNVFRIETSRIGALTIDLSPEMIDFNKKVKVYINGKLKFSQKLDYNKQFMTQNFEKTRDRAQVWVNYINLKIKNSD